MLDGNGIVADQNTVDKSVECRENLAVVRCRRFPCEVGARADDRVSDEVDEGVDEGVGRAADADKAQHPSG